MNKHAKENSRHYSNWLTIASIVGGISGWITYGVIDQFTLWTLPLFCLGATAFTLNGDNVIESFVFVSICGGLAFWFSKIDIIVEKIGFGVIVGSYLALFVSKLGFAYAKRGAFGNHRFN